MRFDKKMRGLEIAEIKKEYLTKRRRRGKERYILRKEEKKRERK